MTHDVIVIGAGPAGMAAACTAAELGLRTALLDEQVQPGGQIYRNVSSVKAAVGALLGPDYLRGGELVERLKCSGVDYFPGTLVWNIEPDLTISSIQDGQARQLRAPSVIAATGAFERPTPIPGWTLPGVMNAGAAQIAMKSAGVIPAGRIVLAGSGPLLLLLACQLLDAGTRIGAIVETSPRANARRAMAHIPRALLAFEYLFKGMKMLMRLRAAGIPWYRAARDLRVTGSQQCTGLGFIASGVTHHVDADVILLHHGVVVNSQLTRMVGVEHVWDDEQVCWRVASDEYGATSLPGFRVAGDGVRIGGAVAAEAAGALAALGAAHELRSIDQARLNDLARPQRKKLKRQLAIRPFLDALYRPTPEILDPADETVVCRCEEVTAGTIRRMASLGCQGPNQTKFFSRCGMGPCQGRVCGTVVTQVLSSALNKQAGAVGAYRVRAPLKPIPLGALSRMELNISNDHEGSA